MKYVALLRGVNVGGNSHVEMRRLKEVCESLGWTNVRTYINSGNVIFTHPETVPTQLAAELAREISSTFGFTVNVLVKTRDELRAVVAATPSEWANNATMKCDVVFVWDGISPRHELAMLSPRAGIDETRTTHDAIIWKVDRVNSSRSGLLRMMGTPLYKQVTVRNINTVRKLDGLIDAGGLIS